jgi:hypothetical protein
VIAHLVAGQLPAIHGLKEHTIRGLLPRMVHVDYSTFISFTAG